jgi:hypothetical protein
MKTKGFFLLLVAFCGLSLNMLHAQMTDGRPRFGVKLGVTGANLYDDSQADDIKSRIGFTGGGFVQIPLAKGRMSLRPELLFTTKGAEYDFGNLIRSEVKFSYVEFPLSLEYRVFSFINLHAGAHASWMASADGKIDGLPVTIKKENFEEFDYGWHAGAGLDLGNIGVHFRLARGLQQVGSEPESEGFIGSLKNSAWSVSASYGF